MIGIYIRVSTIEQAREGYSIAAQRERLTSFCIAQGWTDYKFYVDEGTSGTSTKRPQLEKLISDVEAKQISMILVYRLDRFTRSVLDLHKMLAVLDEYGCAFKSATEPYDTSTAMGRMFITIVAALAQWEAENLSERVKMALEEKVSKGARVGGIPYGFDLDGEKLKKNEKSVVVLDMIEKVRSGMSLKKISNYLSKTNNDKPVWHVMAVRRILRNPALYGATRWNEKVYEDTHEGLITKTEFMKLQQILDDNSLHHRRDVKMTYVLQSVVVCPDCGRRMSVNRAIRNFKSGVKHFVLYRCQPCGNNGGFSKAVNEEKLLAALSEYMAEYSFETDENLVEENPKSPLLDHLKQIELKREKYQRAWASDLMSDEEFQKLMGETREVYEDLKKKVDELEEPIIQNKEDLKGIVVSFNEYFSQLSKEEKKVFVSKFVRKIKFKLVEHPPKSPRNKIGKYTVTVTDVEFR